ncbi:MAG: hypothetical protein ACYSXF_07925 [Planctomycetota bacterium]|jgi:hypothetical protein
MSRPHLARGQRLQDPLSRQRLIRLTAEDKVIYLVEKNAPRRFPNPVLFQNSA